MHYEFSLVSWSWVCARGAAGPTRGLADPVCGSQGAYELLVWLIRTSGAADRGPSAEHLCTGAASRAAARLLPASAADGERPGESERGTSDLACRLAGQAAWQSLIPAGRQRDDEVLEASTDNVAAVAAYQLSVQAGNPLSERRLAQMFGRTSRRWARARIADARQASPLPDSPSTPVTALSPALAASWRANVTGDPVPRGRFHSTAPWIPWPALTAASVPIGPRSDGVVRPRS